jgi:hypothetical protein
MLSIMPYVALSFSFSKPRSVLTSLFSIYLHFLNLNVLYRTGTASMLLSYTTGMLVDMFFVSRVWLRKRITLFFWANIKLKSTVRSGLKYSDQAQMAGFSRRTSFSISPPSLHPHSTALFS